MAASFSVANVVLAATYNVPNARPTDTVSGSGSKFQYVAIGTAGQTVTVKAVVGTEKIDIVTLEIDVSGTPVASEPIEQVFGQLEISGTAGLYIYRLNGGV